MQRAMSWGANRRSLLAGASLLVLGAGLSVSLAPSPALAACTAYSNPAGNAVSTSTGCVEWSAGNLSITNTGSLGPSGTIGIPSLGITTNYGTLTNSGSISGEQSFSSTSNSVFGGAQVNTGAGLTRIVNDGTIAAQGSITGGEGNVVGALLNQGNISELTNAATGTFTATGTVSTGTVTAPNVVAAIANTGLMSTIANSGTISASGTIGGGGGAGSNRLDGIYNAGTIGILANHSGGSVTGAVYGIDNGASGTIFSLTNDAGATIAGTGATGYGIANAGSIGSLTNNGIISGSGGGAEVGIYNNGGTISTLTNNGTVGAISNFGSISTLRNTQRIDGDGAGINNNGNINVLNNDGGTIQGTLYALSNSGQGTIGTIRNSGVIAGKIQNGSTRDLIIAGGDSISQMGTLTGASGGIGSADRGTIVNTSSNLVFNSGYLLLNDDINVTGHTASNTGAKLQLNNTVAVTGNYSQTAGALIFTAASPSSYAYLTVSGNATVTGSQITISGAGLSEGNTFTIVRAGSSGTYSGNTGYVAVTNGLGARITQNGNNLVLTLIEDNGNTYTGKGQAAGGVAAPVGAVLDKIKDANPNGQFTTQILDRIDLLPTASQGDAIKQLAPTRNAPSSQMSNAAATAVLGAVEQHQQVAMAYDPVTGVATGSESRDSAIWGQFLGGGARRGTNSEADGYSLWDFGLATGIDHRFTPNAMGGAALSWVRAWSSGSDNSAGSFSTLDSYQLTLYGTYRLDRAFIDGQAGFGWNQFDQKRAIGFLGSTASAQYSGQQYLAKATIGYDLPVAEKVTVTPLASLRWMRSVTEAYDEEGAGAANLSVDRHGANSVSQDLGAKVSWEVPTGLGLLKPEARLAWVHDYTDGPVATSGIMGGQAFTTTVPRTEADGVKIGLAASLNGDDAVSFRVEYEGELRAQYQSHTGLVKAIWGF